MTTWIAILAVGAGSYLFRVLPHVIPGLVEPSPALTRTLQHAGLAALAALVTTAVRGQGHDGPHLAVVLLAVGTGFIVAARRKPMLAVVLSGFAVAGAATLVLTQ